MTNHAITSQSSAPLCALDPSGDTPLTADATMPPTTDDHSPEPEHAARDQAEDLLAAAEYATGTLRKDRLTTDQTIAILAVMAQVGTGFAQLAAIDAATAQANRQTSLAGALLDEFRAIVASTMPIDAAPADFMIDRTDDVWTHTGNGLYESKQDSGLYDVPAAQIRQQWGPVREYWQHPPSSAPAAVPAAPQWPDLVILGDHGQWRHIGTGEYAFEGIDDLAPLTLAELRRAGMTREYTLLPHSPITAQEADAS